MERKKSKRREGASLRKERKRMKRRKRKRDKEGKETLFIELYFRKNVEK